MAAPRLSVGREPLLGKDRLEGGAMSLGYGGVCRKALEDEVLLEKENFFQ